jgi:hypothetical protein
MLVGVVVEGGALGALDHRVNQPRLRLASEAPEQRVPGRHVSRGGDTQAGPGEAARDRLHRGGGGHRARGKEEARKPEAALRHVRLDPVPRLRHEHGPGDGGEDARAIAGLAIGADRAAVVEAAEGGEGEGEDVEAGAALLIRQKADAAGRRGRGHGRDRGRRWGEGVRSSWPADVR